MKRKINKNLLTLIVIFALIIPAKADAISIGFSGNSTSGKIGASGLVSLLPLPIILPFLKIITETKETKVLFGIAKLTISEHDDMKKYNKLKITSGLATPIELPVPYGASSLKYHTGYVPFNTNPVKARDSDIYYKLSVGKTGVYALIKSNINQTLSVEKEQLLKLLELFFPEGTDLSQYIGDGPFDISISLTGETEGTANPITGTFVFNFTLPEEITSLLSPYGILPEDGKIEGSLAINASFNTDNMKLFFPFATVNLSLTLTYEGEETQLDSITFDLLPKGTIVFWVDLP